MTKLGTLVLECMKPFIHNRRVQAAGCHVIALYAGRLRRAASSANSGSNFSAVLPYLNVIVAAQKEYPADPHVWGDGFLSVAFLLPKGIRLASRPVSLSNYLSFQISLLL